jgi:Superfamily II DNA/RNA helicase required for DNA uptake (late competence protein)
LISNELVNSFKERRNHLIHAVTGAGKTEMLFKVVEEVLKNGFRIAIATPRIDVVDELFPRFQAAFENVKLENTMDVNIMMQKMSNLSYAQHINF